MAMTLTSQWRTKPAPPTTLVQAGITMGEAGEDDKGIMVDKHQCGEGQVDGTIIMVDVEEHDRRLCSCPTTPPAKSTTSKCGITSFGSLQYF